MNGYIKYAGTSRQQNRKGLVSHVNESGALYREQRVQVTVYRTEELAWSMKLL